MRQTRSFRVRLAATIVVLSGGILAATCFLFLKKVELIRERRMDAAIENVAISQLRAFHPKDIWPHVQMSINRLITEEEDVQWSIRVFEGEGPDVVFSGKNWPTAWSDGMIPDLEDLPPPRDRPEGRRERGRPGGSPNDDALDDLLAEFGYEPRRPRGGGPLGGAVGPPKLKKPVLFDVGSAEDGWRVGVFGNQWYTLAVGLNQTAYQSEIKELKRVIYIGFPVGMLLLTLGSFWVAHGALRPVRRITKAADGVTAKGLNQRIELGTADREFAQLITVINEMLARLEGSFTQATRFSSDAAHELKTPITILQGELDQLVQETEPGSPAQERLFSLQDEVQRLGTILRKLLTLSQADGGRLTLSTEEIDLSTLCEELAEDIHAFGPDLKVETEVEPDVKILGDPDTLRQVMQNLVSNAVKYNEPQGWIKLLLTSEETCVIFDIENGGRVIPDDQRGRVFDRFYRGDASRSKQIEGTGLGLNLARELARAHGGSLELMEEGNAFRLILPRNIAVQIDQ